MFLNKLFKKIGVFFKDVFTGADKTWKKLSPEVQNAMLQASGIVDVINKNIEKTPAELLDLINSHFPGLPIDKLKQALAVVSQDLKVAEDINNPDTLQLLTNVRDYLKEREGIRWANASDTVAKIIAAIIAPAGTKFAAIASLLVYVYHTYIKKD